MGLALLLKFFARKDTNSSNRVPNMRDQISRSIVRMMPTFCEVCNIVQDPSPFTETEERAHYDVCRVQLCITCFSQYTDKFKELA